MYVGRIVAVGRTLGGRGAALYRVSSRSFPNREAKVLDKAVAIVPKPGFESDIHKNPYIAYNCYRQAGGCLVVTNGSHTDPVAEKLETGMAPRDALATVMLAMDYEHDHLRTPRIAGIVREDGARGWLAIVRHDALLVREFELVRGRACYICTYERNTPGEAQVEPAFTAETADQACEFILRQGVFADFEKPVTAVCAVATGPGSAQVATAGAGERD